VGDGDDVNVVLPNSVRYLVRETLNSEVAAWQSANSERADLWMSLNSLNSLRYGIE